MSYLEVTDFSNAPVIHCTYQITNNTFTPLPSDFTSKKYGNKINHLKEQYVHKYGKKPLDLFVVSQLSTIHFFFFCHFYTFWTPVLLIY